MRSATELSHKYGVSSDLKVRECENSPGYSEYSKLLSGEDAVAFSNDLHDNCIIGYTVLPVVRGEGKVLDYLFGWWEKSYD